MNLPGLSQLNIELSSRCDKKTLCFMCGHQQPELQAKYGDMDFEIVKELALSVRPPIVISFHRDGDPLVYPRLADALSLFRLHPASIVTHGEALGARAGEIIGNCTTVTVSVIPNDPDREIQLASIRQFILLHRVNSRPMLQLKFVGKIENPEPYEALNVPIIGRALHSKKGDWNYHRAEPIVPEIRVCLDFLGRPTVDWRGRVFICNRLDTKDEGLIGDLNRQSLEEIWNGERRMEMLAAHLKGRRDLANPLCAACEFWGVPTPGF